MGAGEGSGVGAGSEKEEVGLGSEVVEGWDLEAMEEAMEEAEGSDSEGGADSDWEEAEAMATEEVVAGWV